MSRLGLLNTRREWPNDYTAAEAKAWIAAFDAAEGVLHDAGLVDEFGYLTDLARLRRIEEAARAVDDQRGRYKRDPRLTVVPTGTLDALRAALEEKP